MFKQVERAHCSSVWLHETKPHWIVHYPATRATAAHYQAYRAVERVKEGREPWSADNRRIGSPDGFRTLGDAMQAAA